MDDFDSFTGFYPLSKTLRFELKPIGNTLENIKKEGILDRDQHRADSYKEVKKIIDKYHKAYIERALSDFKLKYDSDSKKDSLSEYYFYYLLNNKDENRIENLKKHRKTFASKLQVNLLEMIFTSVSTRKN